MRLLGPIVCGVQVALGLVLALVDCGSCRRGPPLAWAGIGYYSVLAVLSWLPSAVPLVRWMMRWACAVHVALIMTMIHRGDFCGLCVASAVCSLPLLFLSVQGDDRPPWKWGVEFLCLVVVALAGCSSWIRPAPRHVRAPSEREIIVFRSDRCPRCLEFERDVLPRIPKGYKITMLEADDYDYVRVTPTIVIRGASGSKVFEGAPSIDALMDYLPDWHQNPEKSKSP